MAGRRMVSAARRGAIPVALAAVLTAVLAPPRARAQSPAAAANELLASDRAFSQAGAREDLVTSLAAMFADDVIMPAPQGRIARGRAEVVAALRASPANANVTAEWAPVRAGVSADGRHGFTFGFMTIHRPDSSTVPGKYLAYWVKGLDGWRVAAYKRAQRQPGDVLRESMPPSLPDRLVPPTTDMRAVAAHRASLIAAEQAFSDLANRVGLGNAFKATGRADAMNLGGSAPDFVYGNAAIAELVAGGQGPDTKPLTWSADGALVASSGDLGVTFGVIRQNNPPAGQNPPAPYSFFTIWRRDSATGAWKYIAE